MTLMQTTLVLLLDKNHIGILLVCCGFQPECNPNGQKNVVVLENLIIESLHMIETEL